MPYDVTIDHDRRRVASVWHGDLDEPQATEYIERVWSDPAILGYDELVDFRAVTSVSLGTDAMQRLVLRSRAVADPRARARTALVAAAGLVYGLSRMYVSMRDFDASHQREWQVTADYDGALAWLEESPARSG